MSTLAVILYISVVAIIGAVIEIITLGVAIRLCRANQNKVVVYCRNVLILGKTTVTGAYFQA
jgi:hypothetical protein